MSLSHQTPSPWSPNRFASGLITDPIFMSFMKYRSDDIAMAKSTIYLLGIEDALNPNIVTFTLPIIGHETISSFSRLLLDSFITKMCILNMRSVLYAQFGDPKNLEVKFYFKSELEKEIVIDHLINYCYNPSTNNRQLKHDLANIKVYITKEAICKKTYKV
jgi:hypothetical protein